MNNLADVVLHYIRAILFYHDGNIDVDYAVDQWGILPELLGKLSAEERVALSQSAQRILDYFASPPDEYGYKPEIRDDKEKEFLNLLASGELYDIMGGGISGSPPS